VLRIWVDPSLKPCLTTIPAQNIFYRLAPSDLPITSRFMQAKKSLNEC